MKQLIKNIFYHLPIAFLANIVYGFPTRGMKIIGVTGTDGKTTTVNMIYQILKAAGKKVSMISTIDAPGLHTTSPDPFTIQKFAKEAKEGGLEYLVLEVTSHALDQYRFWGIKFDVSVITNITHEHLDYHKTFENYSKTKIKLCQDAGRAVVNQAIKLKAKNVITFGLEQGDFNQKEIKLKLQIPGDYNIENALAAFTVAFALGVDKTIVRKALENFTGIKGRMDEVKNNKGIKIVIDFAHTPNGLEQALKSLRKQSQGRLISLIGCEGYRDTGKRAMMGKIAQRLSDFVIITAVDPRGQLEKINKQILSGIIDNESIFVIKDRSKAIDFAINKLAKYGDTVGIFGKGHETSMNLDGRHEIFWSDFNAVKKALHG